MKQHELITITCDRCQKEAVDDDIELSHGSDEFDLCHECWGAFKNLFIGGLRVDALPRASSDEVIYPPHGFCIGFFIGSGGGMIGPFATEEEARQVLGEARICVVGANFRPNWDR
jgi:hypothetical protein